MPTGLDARTESELLTSARHGAEDAFVALIHRHQAALLRLAGRFLERREDAEDAVQEAIVAAYRQLRRFRGQASFSTWLGRITIYTAIRIARRRHRQTDGQGDPIRHQGDESDPVTAVAVRSAVMRLPEAQRIVVVLRFYEGLSGREIAELVGCRESTVWTRLYAALGRLRSDLDEGDDL